MAGFQQSPGVQIVEKDASGIIPGVSTSVGGTVGHFQWGPVAKPIFVSNENELASIFGKPTKTNFISFFNAADFLAYANALYVVRADNASILNATTGASGIKLKNFDDYEAFVPNSGIGSGVVEFVARYPGVLGNGLTVSMADAATFNSWIYKSEFDAAPGTSDFAVANAPTGTVYNDELHIVVIDRSGSFTGVRGAILEKFAFASKASNALGFDGLSTYYPEVLKNRSNYIYWGDHPSDGSDWGESVGSDKVDAFNSLTSIYSENLDGGTDYDQLTEADLILALEQFRNEQDVEISLMPLAAPPGTNGKLLINVATEIAQSRLDFVVYASVVGQAGVPILAAQGDVVGKVKTFLDNAPLLNASTYLFLDSGYKYRYDRYNDRNIWVPLSGDMAGLSARTDSTNDPWFSPGGFTRGIVKNVIKLGYNPNKAERDQLYPLAVNPVISQPGAGTILFGDKTFTRKPSAFDRINVRRLFIVLEKAIGTAAKFQLFEQNDAVTRNQFVSQVEPFLRDVQARRGIDDFRVIADETNNTPDVIARNEFRGSILVKPVYSINFITLTFTAVGPNVSFETAAAV